MSANGNSWGTWIAIAIAGLVVWQCTREKPEEVAPTSSSYNAADVPAADYAEAPGYSAEKYRSASSGYQDAGAPYGCTSDCSGHDAGWAWAEENGVSDPGDCGGNSLSFEEGCIAYAEEQQAERPDEDRW